MAGPAIPLDSIEPLLADARGRQRLREPPGLARAQPFEMLAQLVLRVGGVERVEAAARRRTGHRLVVQLDELGRAVSPEADVDERVEGGVGHVERLGELGGGALRGRRRVVQLVRQPGRHRPQRGEPLAALLDRGHAAHHRPHAPHHRPVDGRLRERETAEVVGRDVADAALCEGLHAHAERPVGEHRDRRHPGGRLLAVDRLRSLAFDHQRLHRALEQEDHRGWRLALLDQHLARRHRADVDDRQPLVELEVVDVVEEVDAAQLRALEDGRAHRSPRYSWISETAIAPSPTALATLLIERARTSPATNTPGTLVSSR